MTTRRPAGPGPAGPGESRIGYVIGTYPLLTTTFIDREVRELRARGLDLHILSLRPASDTLSPEQEELAATTEYLRPVGAGELFASHASLLRRRSRRYLGELARLVLAPGQSGRQRMRSIGHFVLAVAAARRFERAGSITRVHAHFADRAATVAHVVSRLLGVPYSVTAHAVDIYRSPELLPLKLGDADLVTTCTAANHRHLADVIPDAATRLVLAYHGLDLDRYRPPPAPEGSPPTILAVGQLKEKKGLVHLIDACGVLTRRGIPFRCEIIGDGPERGALEQRVRELDLAESVAMHGARTHDEVVDAYRRATVFTLPCVVGTDGDRDGIPNVILEAMAMRLPIVSTRTSGVPEVVTDGDNGLLVKGADPVSLANALERLLGDPDLAAAMGDRGRARVEADFDINRNADLLAQHFRGAA